MLISRYQVTLTSPHFPALTPRADCSVILCLSLLVTPYDDSSQSSSENSDAGNCGTAFQVMLYLFSEVNVYCNIYNVLGVKLRSSCMLHEYS